MHVHQLCSLHANLHRLEVSGIALEKIKSIKTIICTHYFPLTAHCHHNRFSIDQYIYLTRTKRKADENTARKVLLRCPCIWSKNFCGWRSFYIRIAGKKHLYIHIHFYP